MKKIKVGVISCGMIARSAHIPAYLRFNEYYDVVAVCDINLEAAKKTAEDFSIPNYYGDAEEMLKSHELDVVSVCSGNMSHYPLVMTALKHKVNVICEKPLAFTRREAKEMFDLAEKQGVTLTACQTLRFMPERLAAKRLVDSGEIGEVYSCEYARVRSRGIPNWGKFHIKKYNGGGSYMDMGSHSIDSALWLIGNPEPVSVTARMHTVHAYEVVDPKAAGAWTGDSEASNANFNPADMDVESFSSGCVTFENGIVMLFKATWAANLKDENSISVAGEKLGFNTGTKEVYKGSQVLPLETEPNEFGDHPFFGHFYIIRNFARYLNGEEELMVKPQETINTAAIMEAGYISAAENRTVMIDELK